MEKQTLKYRKHIFVCCNQRPEGARICCGEKQGTDLLLALKQQLREKGLQNEIRAQKTSCFELCEMGPNLVIYPEGVFYGHLKTEDLSEIVEEHLINDRIVERLHLRFDEEEKRAES